MPTRSKWQQLPTEAINPASLAMDTLPLGGIIDLMIRDHRRILNAVQRETAQIQRGAELLIRTLRAGGRIIFVGAGTSGRLGVLEAAEMPPTFGIPIRQVQAIMAGGAKAVHRAKEGVEDDEHAGARAVRRLRLTHKDVVIGISASGVTPFVLAAVTQAKTAGSHVIGVTCDPRSPLRLTADVIISPAVGPELIAGSTRLKAGTATKMVLNILTTAAMVRMGKTYGNLMVDVQINSAKLRDRARRIIARVTSLDDRRADALLRRARGNVKAAIVMQQARVTRAKALARLRQAHDSVRGAIAPVTRAAAARSTIT